jgi:hypothetical protein
MVSLNSEFKKIPFVTKIDMEILRLGMGFKNIISQLSKGEMRGNQYNW